MTTSSPVRIVGEVNIVTDAENPIAVETAAGNFVDIFIQDQDTPPFQYYLMNNIKSNINLTAPVTTGDTVISVSAGHGFTATGERMVIQEGPLYIQSEVVGVVVNDITIRTPVSNDFTIGAKIIRGDIEMNVNGSVVPILYQYRCLGQTPVDIQTVCITMQHPAAGDDSLFGDLAALTNGLLFRKTNMITLGLGNYQQNQDFREFGAFVEYTQKAGAGKFATNIMFDIKNIYGIVIRLDPRTDDILSALVWDDLTDLLRLRVSVMGQFTPGE